MADIVSPQNSTLIVSPTQTQVSVEKPAVASLTIQAPISSNITVENQANEVSLQTSGLSLSRVLDATRTDVGDTTFTYTDGKLVSVVREGVSKTFNYNNDGSLNTLTTVVNSQTIVQTFNYGSDILTSITVS
jgi:hypothetical protein